MFGDFNGQIKLRAKQKFKFLSASFFIQWWLYSILHICLLTYLFEITYDINSMNTIFYEKKNVKIIIYHYY